MATIDKPSSLFKLIFRYMNRNLQTVNAEVTLSPVDPSSEEQSITVSFPPTGRYVELTVYLSMLHSNPENALAFILYFCYTLLLQ